MAIANQVAEIAGVFVARFTFGNSGHCGHVTFGCGPGVILTVSNSSWEMIDDEG
jgi:hypothetical protein